MPQTDTLDAPVRVIFSDLTHTGQIVATNTFPFGAALVAAYAKSKLGDGIDVEVFKYPDDLNRSITATPPRVACFSNYLWNNRLAHAFAERLKRRDPKTVIVFGGPNYPFDAVGQDAFFKANPAVDFHILLEGEQAMAALLETLARYDYDAGALKAARECIPGAHYAVDGEVIRTEPPPRLRSLNDIPSPYTLGLLDKFFDDVLIPVVESKRGCPFSCSFCSEGEAYYNKIARLDLERMEEDLEYIAARTTVRDLLITDSNFGMYKEDLELSRVMARLQKEKGWPNYLLNTSGKNKKERLLEAADILNGALVLTASIQTTDAKVLETVRRKNIALEQILEVGKHAEKMGANSYSEVILCLPGDSPESHIASMKALMDAEINYVLPYQMMMLPGTDAAGPESRARHKIDTRYRILPRCFGAYDILGEKVVIAETDEIAIANDTMSFEQYLDCREFDLSVEVFYNSAIFGEVLKLLRREEVKTSAFLQALHDAATGKGSGLDDLYVNFRQENVDKLWTDRTAVESHIAEPGMVDRYISGELGSSELHKFKAIAFFQRQREMHMLVFGLARSFLTAAGRLSADLDTYLNELERYSLMKKERLHDYEQTFDAVFDFDFAALENCAFEDDPLTHRVPGGVTLHLAHDQAQMDNISVYLKQYGTSVTGLGRLLLRSHVNKLYRKPVRTDADGVTPRQPADETEPAAGIRPQ